MPEIKRNLTLSGSLSAKKVETTMPIRTVMDSTMPEKTSAELINELCTKHNLKYTIRSNPHELHRVELSDKTGVVVTGIGPSVREAINDASKKLGG